jgi:hypothetical protein
MSAYSDTVLADTPFLYYRLGESVGTTATDSSGNARNGTYHASGVTYSAPGLLMGDANTAVTFDGTAGECHRADNLIAFSVLTVEFWMATTFNNTDDMACEFTADASANNGGFWVDPCASSGLFQLLMRSTVTGNTRTGTFPRPTTGVTHHCVFVFNQGADTLKAYVDGVAQTITTGGAATSGVFANSTLTIGARNSGAGLALAATMDEFALYTSELSQVRVTAHYRAGKLIQGAKLGRDRLRGKTRLLPA